MTTNNTEGRALGWDDEIQNDSAEFTLLPPGEYAFTIKGFARSRHAGSDKLPPCNKAVLTVEIDGGEHGKATVTNNLFLHTRTEGLLCQFFRSIGARRSGDKVSMDWGKVTGATGRCKVKQVPGFKDPTKTFMEIDRFLDPEDAQAPAKGYSPDAF